MAWALTGNIKGPTGATGSTGAQGPQGPAGVGFTWRGVWSGSTAYAVNDCVQRTNQSYICIVAGTGFDPASDTTHWNLMAAQGVQGSTGPQGPPGPTAVSTDAGNQSKLGSDSLIYTPGGVNGFISKTAAYTLTNADSNKYIICSGGSWTLTLPTAALGLCFNVRNDQGITGTTGTITIARVGAATIDGQTSLALLPQQECLIISDGTNWRTFGKQREVVLGILDITSSTADSGTILLPVGFRYFLLEFHGVVSSVDYSNLAFQLSFNGGSTWQTSYHRGEAYDSSATALAYTVGSAEAQAYVATATTTANAIGSLADVMLWPGSASYPAIWRFVNGYYATATARNSLNFGSGFLNANGQANAMHFFMASANLIQCFFTLKGVV